MNKQLPFILTIPGQVFNEKHYHAGSAPAFCKNPVLFLEGTLLYNDTIEIFMQHYKGPNFTIAFYTINLKEEQNAEIEIAENSLLSFNLAEGNLIMGKYKPYNFVINENESMISYSPKGTIHVKFTDPYTHFYHTVFDKEILETIKSPFMIESPFPKHLIELSATNAVLDEISVRITTIPSSLSVLQNITDLTTHKVTQQDAILELNIQNSIASHFEQAYEKHSLAITIRNRILVKINALELCTVFDVLDELKITNKNANKAFKEAFYTNILTYIIKVKMLKAYFLVETTDESYHTIGSMYGYYNRGSFSRIFRKTFNTTPKLVRKKAKEKLKNQRVTK